MVLPAIPMPPDVDAAVVTTASPIDKFAVDDTQIVVPFATVAVVVDTVVVYVKVLSNLILFFVATCVKLGCPEPIGLVELIPPCKLSQVIFVVVVG